MKPLTWALVALARVPTVPAQPENDLRAKVSGWVNGHQQQIVKVS